MDHSIIAAELFLEGYNCAQAVAVAFTDLTGMDKKEAMKKVAKDRGVSKRDIYQALLEEE